MDNDVKFDVRLLERNLSRGTISRDEYEKAMKALPDAAGNADNLEAALAERPEATPTAAAPTKTKKR